MAVATVGLWTPPFPLVAVLSWLHILTEVLAGLGYLALIALVVPSGSPGRIAYALQATGRRSLSAYLAQTVVFAALLPAHTLAWGATLGTADAALLALLTWFATVLASVALARRGLPGPAERLMRRLRGIPSARSRT